jgi:long-chain fatty acid transport protein
MLRKLTLALATGVMILALANESKAGGLFLSEFGTEDVGLAGAGWAARAQDASTLFKNPAGMSRLEGNQFQGGLQALYFQGGFSPEVAQYGGGGGGNPVGVAPGASAFYVHSLGKDFKVGLGVLQNFGLAMKFDDGWAGRYYVKQTALVGITFAPVASYRVNEQISIGGGPNIMVAYLKNTANINDFPPTGAGAGHLEVKDTTAGVGGQFGILYEPTKGTRVGVTYYSPIKLDFSDTPAFSNLGPVGTNLQAAGFLNRNLDLGFTVPQRVILSGYHELNDRLAVMGNFGWDNWSKFGEVDVAVTGGQNNPSLTTKSNYDDTYHVGVGSQYRLNPEWLLNGGFAYDSSMVSAANRQLALPVGATYKFGMGANWLKSPKLKLGFSYELSYIGDMSVSQNRGPLAGQVSGEFKDVMMHFFALTLNWGSQGVTFGPGS